MGRYEPLKSYLERQHADLIRMSFADIERIIGRKLPESASTHRAWWSNNAANNVMTRAWLAAGYQSEQVDLPGGKLVFRRMKRTAAMPGFEEAQMPSFVIEAAVPNKLALFGWMKGTVTVAPGVDLTDPADPGWADLIDGDHEPHP